MAVTARGEPRKRQEARAPPQIDAAERGIEQHRRNDAASNLEPLAEVQGALLVVEVLHAPHPELGGGLLVGGEHFCTGQRPGQRLRRTHLHTNQGPLHLPSSGPEPGHSDVRL